MTEHITRNKNVNNFIRTIEKFESASTGMNRGEIQKWFLDGNTKIKKAYILLKKEQDICTILSRPRSIKLNSFFYTPKLSLRNTFSEDSINPIDLINTKSAILITGSLGQGKSMLLRYLQFLELNIGNSIPIFLELRNINDCSKILEKAYEKLNNFGLDCSMKLFNYLGFNIEVQHSNL